MYFSKQSPYTQIFNPALKIGLSLWIFLIPSNLFLNLNEQSGYLVGHRIDYLIPKLHLSLLVGWGVLLLKFLEWILAKKNEQANQRKNWGEFLWERVVGGGGWLASVFKNSQTNPSRPHHWLLFLLVALIIRQLFSPIPVVGLITIAQILTGIAVVKIILQTKFNKSKWFANTLSTAVIFQSLLAIYQFFFQKSLAGYLMLGEPTFSNSIALAKTSWWGRELILPYGTTAHPNILGGFLAIFLLLLINNQKILNNINKYLYTATLILGVFSLFLTQSISAGLLFLFGLSYIYSKKIGNIRYSKQLGFAKLLFLLTIFPIGLLILLERIGFNHPSIFRRNVLVEFSLNSLTNLKILIFGTGLNQFTTLFNTTQGSQLWQNQPINFFQPVHNVLVLWVVESGVIGAAIAFSIFKRLGQKIVVSILVLLPVLALDHFLLSNLTGIYLFLLFMSIYRNSDE